jgi:hypothetical protein
MILKWILKEEDRKECNRLTWLRTGASGGLLRSHEILFWFHNVRGLAAEIVALKEGVFFRKLVGWFVGWLVVWLRAEEQRRCIRNFRVSHNNRCTWLSHKTRTNIADAESLFDTPCITLWQQHSFNRQATNRLRVYSSDG